MKESPTLRFLFELSGVVPLALYAVIHVGSYAGVLFGFERFGTPSAEGAGALALECALLWLPLAFHCGYGAWLLTSPLGADARERQRSLLARSSAVVTLIFLLAHALWLRRPLWSGQRAPEDAHQLLAAGLSTTTAGVPLIAALHLVGIAALATHLDLGLARFAEQFGLLSQRAARRAARVTSLALFFIAAATVVKFATGSALPSFQR